MKMEKAFEKLKRKKEGAYMPHIYYGDPNPDFSLKQIIALAKNGADFLEFGIPFSDPTADGPTFQESCERALEAGVTPKECLNGLKKIRNRGVKLPIIVTTYYNIPFAFGLEKFLKRLHEVGVQGMIIPNLPLEEAEQVLELAKSYDIKIIFQITPNTRKKRIKKITKNAQGFLYIVNVEGVTGARKKIPESTKKLISTVKDLTSLPLMAGFGISEKEHAKNMISVGVDGVITGSALARIYAKNIKNPEKTLPELKNFAEKIKTGCVEGYELRTSY